MDKLAEIAILLLYVANAGYCFAIAWSIIRKDWEKAHLYAIGAMASSALFNVLK